MARTLEDPVVAGTLSALLADLAAAPPPGDEVPEGPAPGTRVAGRFEVIRRIGRGGFGTVVEARDAVLDRHVALKFFRPDQATAAPDEPALAEAEAISRLSHPNILQIHDRGTGEAGPFLVLELLEGEPLSRRLERGPVEVSEVARIGLEVARGLAHAHVRGVVHRDLKPSNVFVCANGQVKILDFGLAHLLRSPSRFGGGTPGWLAPEQLRREPGDERTDVWALGAILLRALAGEAPAGGRPRVPGAPDLEALVEAMLAVDRAHRPRDGSRVVEALEPIVHRLASGPPVARPRVTGWRSRGALAAGVVLALATLAGAAALVRGARQGEAPARSEPATSIAVLPLVNLSGDEAQDAFVDGMTVELTSKLSRLQALLVTDPTTAARYRGADLTATELGAKLRVAYLLTGSVRRWGDRIRLTAGLVRTADGVQVWSEDHEARLDDLLEVQQRLATQVVGGLGVRLAPGEASTLARWGTRNASAYDAYLRGRGLMHEAMDASRIRLASGHFQEALALDPDFAPALAMSAIVEVRFYRQTDSREDRLRQAEASAARALALDPDLTDAMIAAGQVRMARFDYAGAAEYSRRAAAAAPRDAFAWRALCHALGYLVPPPAEAEEACARVLELRPDDFPTHYNLLRIHVLAHRLDLAREDLARLEAIAPGNQLTLAGRFWLALAEGRPRDALEIANGATPTNLHEAWKAMALAAMGDLDAAFAALDSAIGRGFRDASDLRGSEWWAPLRSDPRWGATLARHGIAP